MHMRVDLEISDVIRSLEERSAVIGGGLGPDWAGPAVSTEIANIEREIFSTQGRGRWPPLSPATQKARARRWGYYRQAPAAGVAPEGPALMWTGRLRDSLADPRGRGGADAVIRMAPTQLEQGTKVPYAIYHQSQGARSRLPRRPFLDLTQDDVERLEAVYEEFVLNAPG